MRCVPLGVVLAGRVIEDAEDAPEDVGGALQRFRLAVIGVVSNFKHDQAIEDRRDTANLPRHILRPQLQLSTPLRLPARLQIEQGVQSAMSLELMVPIEVRMDL